MEPGTRLAHYTIASLIGKGGMGEVYQAKDEKLGRQVAIKVLPEEFARDADRVSRFRREAQLLASLNHPNIAAIHGFEETEGKHFLVLELVEGPTLADRIQQGAIPVEESLKLALQIADALKAAHDKGVIHRDLKPLNIKVTDDDNVKVLDFGLAKAFGGDEPEAAVSNSPTLSMAATQQGLILGTAAYMSPEQAKGRAVDKRTDIFAFGCVLYEMLTGQQSFGASDVTESLAAVISLQPKWETLPRDLHPRLREVVERCLKKPIPKRYQDIGDVRVDIEGVLEDPSGLAAQPVTEVAQAAPPSKLPWVAAILLAVVAGAAVWALKPDVSGPVGRFYHVLPEGQQFTNTGRPVVALSPDGSRMVYVANSQLHMRAMDTMESSPIPGTDETPTAPFFSYDGQSIGYWSGTDSQLKRIPVGGGAPVAIADAGNPFEAPSWSEDGTIVYGQGEGILRVSANGGEPELLIAGANLRAPQMLTDGRTVLFEVNGEVAVQRLDSEERTDLFTGTNPRYVPAGHILYGIDDVLYAVPFDVGSLEVTGGPVALVEGLLSRSHYAVSDSGTLAWVPATGITGVNQTPVWVDTNGVAEVIDTIPQGNWGQVRLSPDSGRLLMGDGADVWIYDIASGRPSAVTTDGSGGDYLAWNPDGSMVAYSSDRSGSVEVWVQAADGSGESRQLTDFGSDRVDVDSWSPTGEVLAVHHHDSPGIDIYMIPMGEAEPSPQPFLVDDFTESEAQFSPDGRFVAYYSSLTGEAQLYIRPYPGPGAPTTVSVDGGVEPLWAANGDLFYRHPGTRAMMRVSVATDPALRVGTPEVLFDSQPYAGYIGGGSPRARYDVTRDGTRFVMLRAGEGEGSVERRQINIVLNWFTELRERVPVN